MREFLKKYRWFALAAAILLVAYTGVNTWSPTYGTNQIITHADLVALQSGGNITWKSTPSWTNTDGTGASYTDVNTYVNGCSIAAGSYGLNQLATFGQVNTCHVNGTVHTLGVNMSFASGNVNWTQGGTTLPTINNVADQDGDNWYDNLQSTSGCSSKVPSTCSGTTAQTISISGTPTSQSLSFYYYITNNSGSSTYCAAGTGTASVSVTINSTTYTISSPAYNTWTLVTFNNITSLVNGSNTITFNLSAQSGYTQGQRYNSTLQSYVCTTAYSYSINYARVDNITLQATF